VNRDAFILIVDDDPGAVEAFRPMLGAQGHVVRVAEDGRAALTEIQRHVPAAVVLDLHLPGIDGMEILRRIRSAPQLADVPVAVVTGDYLVDDRITGELQMLGARLYFKPLWEEDLIEIVRTLLESAKKNTC